MKQLLKNYLSSNHTFGIDEQDEYYKFLFLNNVVGFAVIVSFTMGIIRFNSNLFLSSIDFAASLILITLLMTLRKSRSSLGLVSILSILFLFLLFLAIYILATAQTTAQELFFLLLMSTFFLKGRLFALFSLFIIVTTVVLLHIFQVPHLNYSTLNIFTFSIYLIAFYFIVNIYEIIKKNQSDTLKNLNENLEKIVAKKTKELQELAITDQLTGLRNRNGIHDIFQYERIQSLRYKRSLSLIMMDIDFFKLINDKHGHLMGDSVLKELAHTFKSTLRESELIIRWGGEEFLIIATNANETKAKEIAQRIVNAVKQTDFTIHSKVTLSMGIASLHEKETFESLLEKADKALYKAKNTGRDKVVLY